MTTVFAPSALLADGWADNVLIEIDKDGWIVGIDTFKSAPADASAEILAGPVIPGMSNVHSHAFQRAMAGLAERASGKKDTFWSWRETMYRFLGFIEPEDMTALAAQVYVEMLKTGYTGVGEFHYVHHQPDGTPYRDRSVMSRAVVQGALDAGIALTHMPSLYAYGGFGNNPPTEGQRRFINDVDGIMRIIEEVYGEFRGVPQINIGFAPHSLRAVSPEMLRDGVQAFRKLLLEAPIHIHAAEQMGEVEASIAWSGRRPVEWLLQNAPIDDKWCFVHCTHVSDDEVKDLAQSKVVAGLCPTTEANLGDGIFPLVRYFRAGGSFAIGSDSHISVNMFEELRWLEYLQRLLHHERTLIGSDELPSVGAALYDRASQDGARALGRKTGKIEIGYRADLLVIDADRPPMIGKIRDHIFDAAIFAASESPVRDVMAGGRWVVRERRHKKEEQILNNFRRVLEKRH